MRNISKLIFSSLLISVLSFVSGHIVGLYVNARGCGEEGTSNIGSFSFVSNFLNNKVHACTNDVYMGGKWINGYVPIDLSRLDNGTIKSYIRDTISHYNSNQTYINLEERNMANDSYGYIYATDDYYPYESWTARAVNSWYGGWPIDTYYEYERPINIQFNLSIFFDGTAEQEKATTRHEVGHSVGLGHRTDQWTLMYCSRAGRMVYGLTSKDKEVLNIIY